MVDVDHSARVRMSCTGEQIPFRSSPAPADDCQPGGLVGRAAWLAREFPASSPMHRAARDRVFAKIAVVEDASSCWLWTGAVNGRLAGLRDGYGVIAVYIDGRRLQRGAHRVAREIASGVLIPGGLEVMHACDVPRCVRPSHLSVGSHADNMRDAALKGRRNRKLDDAAIREIAASDASTAELAARFGVTSDYIGSIKAGRVRPFVERPVAVERPAFDPPAGMDRNAAIVAARRHGDTLQVIGDRYGITRERVRQIVARAEAVSR